MKTQLFILCAIGAMVVGFLPLFIGFNPILYLATVGVAWTVRGTYIARWLIVMFRRLRGL